MEISIKAEPLFEVFGFQVTNSVLLGIAGYFFVLIWLLWVAKKAKEDPPTKKHGFFTRLAIWCFSALYKTCREIIPNKKICNIVAPFAISLFFYIAIEYYIELLPFVGSAISLNGTEVFRGPVADLCFPFALAILTIVLVQIVAIIKHGFVGNLKRYFKNPFKSPIGFFEGLLELISEFSRLIALAMRLFGNVLAGEILIIIVSWLAGYVSPVLLPFVYIFELFVGGIQAYVFFSLCVVFSGLAVNPTEDEQKSLDQPKLETKEVASSSR